MRTTIRATVSGVAAVTLVGVLLAPTGCSSARRDSRGTLNAPPVENPKLAWLKTADPAAEFRRAVSKGDLRYVGVFGGALMPIVPSFRPEADIRWLSDPNVRFLPTSASCAPNEINPDFDRAISYARRYNALLRQHLAK